MPNNVTAKIKLAPKRTFVVLSIVLLAIVGFAIHSWQSGSTLTLQTAKGTRQLEVADTNPAREKGLGDRSMLPVGQGMIFVYDQPAIHCFWMKDMRFSLDMIWVDSNRTVVHIEKHVSPKTYPKSYCPGDAAQYVIELNAGQADQLGIAPGQRLRF